MSIDPLSLLRQAATLQGQQADRKSGAPPGASFADTLNALKPQEDLPRTGLESVAVAAQLAQLRMLQGLFLVDDDETAAGSGLLDSLDLKFSTGAPLPAGQKLDRLYARQHPTLLEPEPSQPQPSGRHQIESLIKRVAGQVSLAPELIRSVVAAESDFQADAVSPVGAQGLMQLMPATAKELGVADSFDPQQNLLGGSRYLKQLLDKYGGDLDRALAAYNWGQGNVDRKGLEGMPRETRDYLARVKSRLVG